MKTVWNVGNKTSTSSLPKRKRGQSSRNHLAQATTRTGSTGESNVAKCNLSALKHKASRVHDLCPSR